MHMELKRHDRTASEADKDRAERTYRTAYAKLQTLTNLFTKDEYLDRLWADALPTVNRG